MRAKQFFYVCAGLLMLASAYQLGVTRANAQLGGEFAGIHVGSQNTTAVVTTNGDIYARAGIPQCDPDVGLGWGAASQNCDWTYMGNVLGGTISVEPSTMSKVKEKYRDGKD